MEKTRTYTYDARRFDPRETMNRSGLEYLQHMLAGEVAGSSLAQTLGFTLTHLESGRVVFAGDPQDYVFNPIGSVHGGYAAAMLDSALGCCVQSVLEVGVGYTTVELKVNYVRGMTDRTGVVCAEGNVIHVGKSIATAEARLVGRDDGKLYAHGSTTCFCSR
ncbi:MAG: PaaI family thioesterase [Pleurocapsa sp. SU_196_0]|nr:PaaI family thioesterase [Pleurocapsa sp. SU_196_0]